MTERGSISVLTAGLVGLVVLLGMMLLAAGYYLSARAETQAAADAAALAAAPITFRPFQSSGDPAREAARLAAANEATLVRCLCPIDRSWAVRIVEVEVVRATELPGLGQREIRAVAAAEFSPVDLLEE